MTKVGFIGFLSKDTLSFSIKTPEALTIQATALYFVFHKGQVTHGGDTWNFIFAFHSDRLLFMGGLIYRL
jgi:hypothetical protein